jgi:hypothetical protein
MKNLFGLTIIAILLISCSSPESEFQKAKEKNSIQAFDEFIKKYPESSLVNEAEKLIYLISFDNTKDTNTIEAFEEFLRKYPIGEFTDSAKQCIYILSFEKVISYDSLDLLQSFLNEYPNGKYTDTITNKIYEIAFQNAIKIGTIDSYKSYIESYPESYLVKSANERIAELTPITDTEKIKAIIVDYEKKDGKGQKAINVLNRLDTQALEKYLKAIGLPLSLSPLKVSISDKESSDVEISDFSKTISEFNPFLYLCGKLYLEGHKNEAKKWLTFVFNLEQIVNNSIDQSMSFANKSGKSNTLSKMKEILQGHIDSVFYNKFPDDNIHSIMILYNIK